ncbi:MAG: alpha/beta hydrolase [Steroidobacteraceae bacterium]
MAIKHPPFDPELAAVIERGETPSFQILPEHIPMLRMETEKEAPSNTELERNGAITVREISIPSSTDGFDISILMLTPTQSGGDRPGLLFIHGGGMVAGSARSGGLEHILDWAQELGIAVASVDYRLAPEHPDPIPVEDCYAALRWVDAQRTALGIDRAPLMIAGMSAGGGLAAGLALLARDRRGPAIAAQILICPMLDDRQTMPSSLLDGIGVWDRTSNNTGWTALLGDRKGMAEVSPYAAPARATDLSGLPPAFLDVGAVEVFRDEVIDYAARLMQAGVSAELHVWAGAFHGFDSFAPHAAVSKSARDARLAYLRRRLKR